MGEKKDLEADATVQLSPEEIKEILKKQEEMESGDGDSSESEDKT
ncbi:MAG: hypothetical protein AAF434_20270 [Pseudomonadota bacterium]